MGISHPFHNRVCLPRPWVQFQNPHQTLGQVGTVYGPIEEKELQEEEPSTGHLVKPWQSQEYQSGVVFGSVEGGGGGRKLSNFLLSLLEQRPSPCASVQGWANLLLGLTEDRGGGPAPPSVSLVGTGRQRQEPHPCGIGRVLAVTASVVTCLPSG